MEIERATEEDIAVSIAGHPSIRELSALIVLD